MICKNLKKATLKRKSRMCEFKKKIEKTSEVKMMECESRKRNGEKMEKYKIFKNIK